MSKSYVTMEQHQCPACGECYDTGVILMDRRLLPSFERYTVTGWEMCKDCMKNIADGLIALIEVDPKKSKIEAAMLSGSNDPDCAGSITPNNAHPTGRMMWIPLKAIEESHRPPSGQGMVYVEPGVLEIITKQAKPHPTVQ